MNRDTMNRDTMNRQILLASLPDGPLRTDHFRLQTAPMPQATDGQVLVRTLYLSLDAANRAWMQGATYRAAVGAGDVMPGGVLAEVVESRADGYARSPPFARFV